MKNTESIKRIQSISEKMDIFLKQSGMPVCFFDHATTFGNGMSAYLSSNADMPIEYHKTRPPMMYTNEKGRTLKEGAYLSRCFSESEEYSGLMTMLQGRFSFRHSISIAINGKDRQHLYSFYFNCNETQFLQHIINNYYRYQQVINQYHEAFSDIIDNEYEKHQSDFPLSDVTLSQDSSFIVLDDTHANKIINPINADKNTVNLLSPQQIRCLTFLIKGMSSKDIATEMRLSHRTIEHYIATIRVKLNSKNTKELIAKYSARI